MWKILEKQKEVTEDDIERLAEYTGWRLIVEEDKWLNDEK